MHGNLVKCFAAACAVVAGTLSVAEATWQPPAGATQGTAGTDSFDNKIAVSGGGTASTSIRARCNPCPTCDTLPQVTVYYTVTFKKADGTTAGTAQSALVAECACPTSAIPVQSAGATGAKKATVSMRIKCGCCDANGGVVPMTPEETVTFMAQEPIEFDTASLP